MKRSIFVSVLAGSLFFCFGAGSALAASLQSIIEEAEQTFGGEAFAAETFLNRAEVQVLSGTQIVETLYNAETGQLISSEEYGFRRLVRRVTAALDQAVLSLVEAIEAADDAVGPGEALESALSVSRRNGGERFFVEIRADGGVFDVIVDSATGQIIRIIRD